MGLQPYPVIYVVANPVRGLLDRKRSEKHLQSSNESKTKTQTNKNDEEKGIRTTKYTCQKKIDEGHSIERVWHSASRESSGTLPGSQPCTQTRSIYHIIGCVKNCRFAEVAVDLCPCDNIIPYETVVCKGEGGSLTALIW